MGFPRVCRRLQRHRRQSALLHRHRAGGFSRAALYQYLQSFLAVLFAVILLGEHITPVQVLGGIIVVGGIIFGRSSIGRRRVPHSVHAAPAA